MAETPTYQLGTWSGLDLFICLLDGYNVFDLDKLTEHLLDVHGLPAVVVPPEE